MPTVQAYSDGSVIGNGVEGSASAIVRLGGRDVSSTIRMASADAPLSSGRAEWAGLVEVLFMIRRVRARVEIRLDNLQVVNTFNDGDWQFVRNWLRRNDRDMAVLAWDLLNERRVNGLGEVVAIHQHGHAERRK